MISKCKHPGLARRFIAIFAILGTGFADQLLTLGLLIMKIANTLRFEHFWVRYIENDNRVVKVPSFSYSKSKNQIWDLAIKLISNQGSNKVMLEFGTNNGGSLLYFQTKLPPTMQLHGFDCFEGIPESWDSLSKGSIKGHGYPSELWSEEPLKKIKVEVEVATTGKIPLPPQPNIVIHKGLFANTLPEIMTSDILENISFIHFDADIYMATRPVLDAICGQIKHTCYILFDEFYSVNHEFKAWLEFVDVYSLKNWRIIATSEDGSQVLFQIN